MSKRTLSYLAKTIICIIRVFEMEINNSNNNKPQRKKRTISASVKNKM